AGIAHEINNPLSFVANNLAVLERDVHGLLGLLGLYKEGGAKLEAALASKIAACEKEIDLPYLRESLGGILQRSREGVERVSRIIHSLRGLARTEAAQHQENVNLVDLIDNSLEILHGRFKRTGITVEQEHDPNPRVACVETQIGQLILNLLLNAFQAVESSRKQGGVVRIRTARRGKEMMIEVQDNGPGIRPEDHSRLFDPFFTTKDVGEGTGLGLAITHNIVEAHGGHIDVESVPGQGATFRVCLPLKKPRG